MILRILYVLLFVLVMGGITLPTLIRMWRRFVVVNAKVWAQDVGKAWTEEVK